MDKHTLHMQSVQEATYEMCIFNKFLDKFLAPENKFLAPSWSEKSKMIFKKSF
jgi:hypothetical protein